MRFFILGFLVLSLTACLPAKPVPQALRTTATPLPRKRPLPQPPAPPSAPPNPSRVSNREIAGITFTGVDFDSRKCRLIVVDQANGPGSQYPDSAAAARTHGGIAALNAGFFTPQGAPLGLVLASGKISGTWNSASSLGSGAWYETSSGHVAIARREQLGRHTATTMRELIQAGPLLVENGRSIGGLETTKVSARSVILWDGGTRWWLGGSSPCTLAALTQALATGQPADWPIRQALNLDGGRSSDLWISSAIPGGPFLNRPPWNRPVRNFLVLVAK